LKTPNLFSPVRLGALEAPNRIVMASLTGMRAGPGRVPTPLMAEYYAYRAVAGLIITEATAISRQGTDGPNSPGIYTDEQVAGWQRVTEAVHRAGGRIFLQLWHMGRISHPSFQPDGGLPVAPSAIAPRSGQALTENGMQPYVTPRALKKEELPGIVAQYAAGAQRARIAGFDGVEIHNANGCLLDQFLCDGTKVWGADRVGICFSPGGVFNDMHDSNPLATFSHVLYELNRFNLACAHLIMSTEDDLRQGAAPMPLAALRQKFHGPLIVANDFTYPTAKQILEENLADAAAFERLFIANPDLPSVSS
jgi:N-ethylmaleimide reductase